MALDLQRISFLAEEWAGKQPADIINIAIREYSPDVAISFSGAEDVVLIDMACEDRREVHGLLARHRAPAPRDLPVHREGARALRHPDRDVLPAARSGAEAGAREGALLLLPRRPQGVLRRAQGRAAARALKPLQAWITGQRRDQSPGTRAAVPVVQPIPTFGSDTSAAGEVQSARELDVAAGVGLHPRERCAVQRAARARLHLDRLRALHARRPPRRARARRPLVVGRRDDEGVRPARRQRLSRVKNVDHGSHGWHGGLRQSSQQLERTLHLVSSSRGFVEGAR